MDFPHLYHKDWQEVSHRGFAGHHRRDFSSRRHSHHIANWDNVSICRDSQTIQSINEFNSSSCNGGTARNSEGKHLLPFCLELQARQLLGEFGAMNKFAIVAIVDQGRLSK